MANPISFSSKLFQQQKEDPMAAYSPLAQSCVAEAVRNLALSESDAQTIKPRFEYHLCDAVGREMVVKQATLFKKQFETTGTITAQEMETAYQSIDRVFSGGGKFSGIPNAKHLLLSLTLSEIEKISPAAQQKGLAQKLVSSFFRKSPEAILAEKKVETLNQMKESMRSPMLSTTAPLWGENEKWENPEPAELETPNIYPELEDCEVYSTPSTGLYPNLSGCGWVNPIPEVTDPGFRLHLRVSYIDLAFPQLIKAQDDQKAWDALPGAVQRDALRHCIYLQSCSGAAEELACRLFQSVDELKLQLQLSQLTSSSPSNTGLSDEFISHGEQLLELYYSDAYQKSPWDCLDFATKFNLLLPPETPFLQYVYEMAKATGIRIEDWDHDYAKNHWKKIDMINLSVQALERCLHTKAR